MSLQCTLSDTEELELLLVFYTRHFQKLPIFQNRKLYQVSKARLGYSCEYCQNLDLIHDRA